MRRLIISLFLVVCLGGVAMGAGPDDVAGKWLNQDKDAVITIYKCNSLYCGSITWLKEPNYPADDKKGMAGMQKVDRENPDAALRKRPIQGLVILWGFKYSGDNVWEEGRIYDPKEGKTYKCKMTLAGDKLNIRGFIGISFIGRTNAWSRQK